MKKSIFENITPKSLKEAANICSPLLCDIWAKEIVQKWTFPKDLKNVHVTPIFKKDSTLLAKKYRPVSLLPTVSKIFEYLIDYINQYLFA